MRISRTLSASIPLFAALPHAAAAAQQQESPLQIGVDYTWDAGRNLRGGLREGSFQLGNLDVQLQYSSAATAGVLKGTTFFLYGLGNHGSDPTSFTGDAQVFTNIAAPRAFRVYEAWAEKRFANDRASALLGLYDLNSEFDAVQTSSLFLNSSFGIGVDFSQSGENGPSIFPVTSLAIRLRAALSGSVYGQVIALDGVSGYPDHPSHQHIVLSKKDGALLVGEIGLVHGDNGIAVSRSQDTGYNFRASIGGWAYTARSEPLLGGQERGNRGFYGAVDALVFEEGGSAGQGLSLFARAGIADAKINRVASYFGAGAVYAGAMPGRDEDQLGLAIAAAVNGSSYKRLQRGDGMPVSAAESSVEFTYFAQLLSWASLQLDAQYIINPNTDPSLSNALVTSARLVLSYRPF
jgi:porin